MTAAIDITHFVEGGPKGMHHLYLMVEGMRCAGCAWKIESALNSESDVNARINLSTKRLSLEWKGVPERANDLIEKTAGLGFRLTPFDAGAQKRGENSEERFLLKCIAVAGFASGNLMAFS